MGRESSPVPPLEHLRSVAAEQGVHPADVDIEAVLGFLARILPALEEIEERLPEGTPT
jgi:hypothetical protein